MTSQSLFLIQNKLDEAKSNKKQISLIWIPVHADTAADIKGHATADKHAKLVIQTQSY